MIELSKTQEANIFLIFFFAKIERKSVCIVQTGSILV